MEKVSDIIKAFGETMGTDWYVDDSIEDNVIAAYDPNSFLNYVVTTAQCKYHNILTMFENDEIVIKIKKVES